MVEPRGGASKKQQRCSARTFEGARHGVGWPRVVGSAYGVGAGEVPRYRDRRKQLRAESRLGLFRMGAALTISLGAGTGLHFEDTKDRLALYTVCRRAFLERKLAAPAREPLDNS